MFLDLKLGKYELLRTMPDRLLCAASVAAHPMVISKQDPGEEHAWLG
jgi:hypothetical protein